MKKTNRFGLTTWHLKILAIVTMLIDHTAIVTEALLPETVYMLMRCIGRIAFPVFCFLLVEGFVHTRNRRRYAGRLALFCFLSEPCFDIVMHGEWIYTEAQNVFWTLLFGFLMMAALEALRKRIQAGDMPQRVLSVLASVAVTALAIAAAAYLETDYSYKGILTILVFYCFRNHRAGALTAFSLVNLLAFSRFTMLSAMYSYQMPFAAVRPALTCLYIQDAALVAIFPISLYNGEKGRSMKWFFYLFYPVHLLLLYVLGKLFIWR